MDHILPQYEVQEIPSRFIPYPETTRIFVQPYRAGEAINIELVGRNNLKFMEEILSGIRVEGLAKNLLTPQDILFLGVYRNLVSSKHDKIDMKSICPHCLNENHDVKTLKAIKFNDIDKFDRTCYPIEVDFDNYVMHFTFVTYKDFEFCMNKYRGHKLCQLALQVIDYTDKQSGETFYKPEYNARSTKPQATAIIERYIQTVKDILYNFVDEDKEALEEVISILEDYGIKPIETTCSDERCKRTYSFEIDDEGVLVTPFREPGKSARNRIKLSKSDVNRPDSIQTDEPKGSMSIAGLDREASKEEQEQKRTTVHLKQTVETKQYQPIKQKPTE